MSITTVGKMDNVQPVETTAHVSRQTHDEFVQDEDNLLRTVIDLAEDKNRIVTRTPDEPFRLTFIDVTCLVVNRTIGTGIFSGPQEVMKGVRSPGIAMLMWLLGCIWSLSGAHVFIEYGLNVPRYVINGVEQSVPRSGGELHYLQYVFPWPRFKEGTVLFSGVIFGISFICVGNMASNCVDCALRLLQAANPQTTDESYANDKKAVYGIAVTIAIVTCFIHAFSRRGGIFLSNLLAVVKVCFMMVIIFATWAVAGGPSGISALRQEEEDILASEPASYNEHSGYTQAFTTIVFALFGFYQPNYVLSEIKNPRKTLPRSVWWGMGIVCALYLGVNVCYMIIVPVEAQINNNVAQEFFKRVFNNNYRATQTVNAFLAISSFGNIVVWTFTAVRMKQEIAKQCFIPLAGFFAKDRDFSFGRLLYWLERGRNNSRQRKIRFLNPANHQELTPVGALVLHLITCVILLMVTYGMSPKGSYLLLSKLLSYLLAACFGTPLALGILVLHLRGPPTTEPIQTANYHHVPQQQAVEKSWSEMIKGTVDPKVGIVAAVIYLIGNLYLVIMTWVPPANQPRVSATGEWYTVPVISWSILGFSALWYLGFLAIIKYRSKYGDKDFIYMRKPEFEWAQRSQQSLHIDEGGEVGHSTGVHRRGGLILARETIYRKWQAKETGVLSKRNETGAEAPNGDTPEPQQPMREQRRAPTSPNLQNTDFE